MSTFKQLFFGGGGAQALGDYSLYFFSSRTHTFTAAGTAVITIVGATGSGARGNTGSGAATGSNSAPWGRLKIAVAAGDVLTVNIGAGGAAQSGTNVNGLAGSNTTVALNGVTILTAQPGEPGVYNATAAVSANATATVTGADFVVSGLRAGNATGSNTASGGAALDVLRSGLGRSPNSTVVSSPGGSVGTDAGGNTFGYIAYLDFGFVPSDGRSDNVPGRGGGGGATVNIGGPFAGGASGSTAGGAGGIGGGAGGSVGNNPSGAGSPGFVYATFTPSE